jgi:hypothetical protein
MKIKYWLVIVLLGGVGVFLAGNLYSEKQKKNNQTLSENVKSSQVKSLELRACRDEAGINGDPSRMDEQALRSYMMRCSNTLLANENFSALDSTIAYLRNNKIRTPAGMWLQSQFYDGIAEYLGNANTETWVLQIDESLRNWIAASSNPDTAHMAMTELMLHKAFQYRGTGYAAEVSEENFKLFYQEISRAKKYLLEHEDIAARDPEWFALMLVITRVEENSSDDRHRGYFDKAVRLYPDYYPIYFIAAENYLPKWGGGKESFDEFARDAGKNLSSEKASAVYARIYWAKVCTRCGDKDVANWRDRWPDLKVGFDQVIQDYPDQWNVNSYARIACSAYDQQKTLALLGEIKGEPITYAWNDEKFSYDYCAKWSGFSRETNDDK